MAYWRGSSLRTARGSKTSSNPVEWIARHVVLHLDLTSQGNKPYLGRKRSDKNSTHCIVEPDNARWNSKNVLWAQVVGMMDVHGKEPDVHKIPNSIVP